MPLRVIRLRTANGDPIELGKFTVLVGPNNSGKSQTLRDILEFAVTGSNEKLIVAKNVEVELPNEEEGRAEFTTLPHQSVDHFRVLGVSFNLKGAPEIALHKNWIHSNFEPKNQSELLRILGRFWVAHLDAESRLGIASPTDSYDLRQEKPSNALQAFFAGGSDPQEKLRKAFKEAFDMDVALDWAAMKRWYLRVRKSFGETIPNERDRLDTLLGDAPALDAQGDGYRSFAGVVLALLTFQNRLILLDEPDAFLHPAQARVLGRWLGTRAQAAPTQVILATHNSDFLWGLVSSNPDVCVIRLNRSGDNTQYHLVSPETTKELVQSPLLSSQPVLDSLFQQGVAVCEGDADRAIYQTVAHHSLAALGGESVLFIHANGKEAIKTPVKLLRAAGTPVCAVVDFDVFNSEVVLSDLYEALTGTKPTNEILDLRKQVAELVENQKEEELLAAMIEKIKGWLKSTPNKLRQARKELQTIADKASKWDTVKANGINSFTEKDRPTIETLIKLCSKTGIFIVQKGELESWMELGVRKGKEWNRTALDKLHHEDCPLELEQFVTSIINHLLPSNNVHSKPD